MKVICIDDRFEREDAGDPKMGDIVTVVSNYKWGSILVYVLKEFPRPGGYDANAFAPISEIDETEMERNYNQEKVLSK